MQLNKFKSTLDNGLYNFDITLFHKINHDWTNPFFDFILPLVRESMVWIPLYVFLVIFGYMNFGIKGLYWMLTAIITVIISNYISSDIIKPLIDRPRPCRDSMLEPAARLLINRCPGSGSLTSSHAVNHYTLAMFLFLTLRNIVSWSWWFFVWAGIICYAQVYVGVHFPVDVIFGAFFGIGIGYIAATLFNYRAGQLLPLQKV